MGAGLKLRRKLVKTSATISAVLGAGGLFDFRAGRGFRADMLSSALKQACVSSGAWGWLGSSGPDPPRVAVDENLISRRDADRPADGREYFARTFVLRETYESAKLVVPVQPARGEYGTTITDRRPRRCAVRAHLRGAG